MGTITGVAVQGPGFGTMMLMGGLGAVVLALAITAWRNLGSDFRRGFGMGFGYAAASATPAAIRAVLIAFAALAGAVGGSGVADHVAEHSLTLLGYTLDGMSVLGLTLAVYGFFTWRHGFTNAVIIPIAALVTGTLVHFLVLT